MAESCAQQFVMIIIILAHPLSAQNRPALIGTSATVVNRVQFIVGGSIMAVPGRALSGTGLIARIAEKERDADGSVYGYQWTFVAIPMMLSIALFLFLSLRET